MGFASSKIRRQGLKNYSDIVQGHVVCECTRAHICAPCQPCKKKKKRLCCEMASDFARHYGALSRLFVHFWTDAQALILK